MSLCSWRNLDLLQSMADDYRNGRHILVLVALFACGDKVCNVNTSSIALVSETCDQIVVVYQRLY